MERLKHNTVLRGTLLIVCCSARGAGARCWLLLYYGGTSPSTTRERRSRPLLLSIWRQCQRFLSPPLGNGHMRQRRHRFCLCRRQKGWLLETSWIRVGRLCSCREDVGPIVLPSRFHWWVFVTLFTKLQCIKHNSLSLSNCKKKNIFFEGVYKLVQPFRKP